LELGLAFPLHTTAADHESAAAARHADLWAPEAIAEWRLQIEILADVLEESLGQQGRAIQDALKTVAASAA